MYALILSGLAMQMVGNSRPASCAEHHLSHLWEMEVINGHLDALHGEKVSVGMMLVLKEYKRIAQAIRQGLCQVKTYEPQEALLEETFGKKGLLDGIKKRMIQNLFLKLIRPNFLKVFRILQSLLKSFQMKMKCCVC